jgi:hypothetical protein
MHTVLPYVGAFITLSSLQVWELAIERWLLLNLPFLILLVRLVVRRNLPRATLLVPFIAPTLATVILALGPSYVINGTRVPEPSAAKLALSSSLLTATITGVGGLAAVLLVRGSLLHRLLGWLVASLCAAVALFVVLPKPYRLLYVPWSMRETVRALQPPPHPTPTNAPRQRR